jgi:putative DNA methylase
MGARLMAVVAEDRKGRLYLTPDDEQVRAADVEKPEDYPTGKLCDNPRWFSPPAYGLDEFDKLFTNRQLTALTTFSDLVAEAQERACRDAVEAGLPDDGVSLDAGGTGALAYGQAVGVYLAFVVDKLTDYHSTISSWNVSRDIPRNTFGRQAIPMTWDYAECNPFCESSGSFNNMLEWVVKAIDEFPRGCAEGCSARQFDAQSDNGLRNLVVSTDPPYYDNIGYADLSDYFYVWLRQSLRRTYPQLFSTMLVPKAEELVATPYRDGRGKEGAKLFFEDGMAQALKRIYAEARDDVPVTVYYAFKQSETEADDEGQSTTASTGWETMLSAIINAGFSITGTWPMRTEMVTRQISQGTNALASSIVLVCRKRGAGAPVCTRREFVAELRRELPGALAALQASNIAPVDLAQSAIGPGIAVYSRYAEVLESDGSALGVRAALQLINRELDSFMSGGDADVDRHTRLALTIYEQAGFGELPFGAADQLARAKNDSVEALAECGVAVSGGGKVRLVARDRVELREGANPTAWVALQLLAHRLQVGGIEGCAEAAARLGADLRENVRALAYRAFAVAERKGWVAEASVYNELIASWGEVVQRAFELQGARPAQETLF